MLLRLKRGREALQIKILGRPIEVTYTSKAAIEMLANEPDALGFFDGSTIFIRQSLNEQERARVFLHEAFHVMLMVGGLSSVLEELAEEAVCTLAENFADLLQDKDFRDHL